MTVDDNTFTPCHMSCMGRAWVVWLACKHSSAVLEYSCICGFASRKAPFAHPKVTILSPTCKAHGTQSIQHHKPSDGFTPPLPIEHASGCTASAGIKVLVTGNATGLNAGAPQKAVACQSGGPATFTVPLELSAGISASGLNATFQCGVDQLSCVAGALEEATAAPKRILPYTCTVPTGCSAVVHFAGGWRVARFAHGITTLLLDAQGCLPCAMIAL